MEASQIQHGEPRRLVMSAPIPLRRDFVASQLRGLARKTKDGPQARRLLALAAIYDGGTRTEAAKIGGVGLQIIRDWVVRFNAGGPDGLLNGKSPGQPPKLTDVQRHQAHGVAKCLEFARPMMRRCAGLDTDETRRQLLEESNDVTALQLAPDDHIAFRVNAMDLKNRLRDVETNRRDSLHGPVLRIRSPPWRPRSVALTCRWRS